MSVSMDDTILEWSPSSSAALPKPPDNVKPPSVRLTSNVRRRSRIVSVPYPTQSGVGGKAQAKQKDGASTGNSTVWDKTTGQQVSGVHPSTPSFLKHLLQSTEVDEVLGAGKPKKRKTVKTATRVGRHPSPFVMGPAASYGKSPEDMYDEIVQLKKSLHVVAAERDALRGRTLRVEQELLRKNKQIDDLLAAGHVSQRDVTRSLAEKKTSLSASVSSLKQQIHSYQSQLKEKEKVINSLTHDTRSSRVEKLEIQAQTYYVEVLRLRKVLDQQTALLQTYTPRAARDGEIKVKALNEAIKKLSDELLEVTQAKSEVEKELVVLRHRSAPPPAATHHEVGSRASIADKYVDCKREEMIAAVVDLELLVHEKDHHLSLLSREKDEEKTALEKRIDDLQSANREQEDTVQKIQASLTEAEASLKKLRKVIHQVKEDRSHYRTQSEQLRSELDAAQAELSKGDRVSADLRESLHSTQSKIDNEEKARQHASKLAKRNVQLFAPDKARRVAAASVIQEGWRRHRSEKKQRRFDRERENAVALLQSAFQGHLVRKRLLGEEYPHSAEEEGPERGGVEREAGQVTEEEEGQVTEEEEAIQTVQGAFKGHLTRKALMDT